MLSDNLTEKFKNRYIASDEFFSLVFPDHRKVSASVAEVAKDFLPLLASYTRERIRIEEAEIKEDLENVCLDIENAVTTGDSDFSQLSSHPLPPQMLSVSASLDQIKEILGHFRTSLKSTQSSLGTNLLDKRGSLKNLSIQAGQISELLEIPHLIQSCIQSGCYDEAADLVRFVASLPPSNNFITALQAKTSAQKTLAVAHLVSLLSGTLLLPQGIKIISALVKIFPGEPEAVRTLFFLKRGEALTRRQLEIEAAKSAAQKTLRDGAEFLRCEVAEFCMQSKSIFPEDARVAGIVAKSVAWFLDLTNENLKSLNFQEIDGSALLGIVRNAHHAAATLRRSGVNFFPAWLQLIAGKIDACVHAGMAGAAEALEQELRRSSGAVEGVGRLAEIGKFRALAVFYAEAVNTLNELRLCPLLDCEAPARQSLEVALKRAAVAVEASRRTDASEMGRVLEKTVREVLEGQVALIFK